MAGGQAVLHPTAQPGTANNQRPAWNRQWLEGVRRWGRARTSSQHGSVYGVPCLETGAW